MLIIQNSLPPTGLSVHTVGMQSSRVEPCKPTVLNMLKLKNDHFPQIFSRNFWDHLDVFIFGTPLDTFVTEYPIWVFIKRTLVGKFAIQGQNFIYCVILKENVPKPSKFVHFLGISFSSGYFLPTGHINLSQPNPTTT